MESTTVELFSGFCLALIFRCHTALIRCVSYFCPLELVYPWLLHRLDYIRHRLDYIHHRLHMLEVTFPPAIALFLEAFVLRLWLPLAVVLAVSIYFQTMLLGNFILFELGGFYKYFSVLV